MARRGGVVAAGLPWRGGARGVVGCGAQVLARERDARRAAARDARRRHFDAQLARAARDLAALRAPPPADLFRAAAAAGPGGAAPGPFARFDERGLPTHRADGTAVGDKERRSLDRELRRAEAERAALAGRLAAEPGLEARLEARLEALRAERAALDAE